MLIAAAAINKQVWWMDRNLEAMLQFGSLPDSRICNRISEFFHSWEHIGVSFEDQIMNLPFYM